MNSQIRILTNKINRIKHYTNTHKLHTKKIDSLFHNFSLTVYRFEKYLSKHLNHSHTKYPDNIALEKQEWHDHLGSTDEVRGLANMDAYDRAQVFGPEYEHNIQELNMLYQTGIKYYIIRDNILKPFDQDILKHYVNHFTFKEYFPAVTA